MDPRMVLTLLVSVAAFTLLYFYLLRKSVAISNLSHETEMLKEQIKTNM